MHEFSLSHIPRKAWPEAVFGENGQSYEVDADFRTVLKCLRVLRDEDIRERDRLYLLKQWFFRGQDVPGGLEKFIGFAFGECREPSEQPRMMDFEQDADAIYASFLMAYGMDLTEIPFLHWYKFLVLLRLLGEDTPLEKRIALRGMDTSKLKGEARIRAERAQQAVALRSLQAQGKKPCDRKSPARWKRERTRRRSFAGWEAMRMPVDGTLIFDTEIDRSGIEKGSKLAKSDLEKLGTQVKDIFSSKSLTSGLADLGGKLVGAFAFAKLTQGLGQVATAAIKYNAQMEAYQTNFSVMLGDEAKGVEYVAQLREKAAKTPFGMEDLASAAQTMLSFGMDAENANTAMDRLGDIALGNKDKFQSLSLAFSQISAAGKLTGEDLLQMVNAGFNPLNTLAEKTGTSLGDLKDVMSGGKGSAAFRKQMKDAQNEVKKLGAGASEGAKLLAQIGQEGMISAEMVGKAMEIETSPGGRFYDGMENASKTLEGQFSTLKDNSMQLVGNIFSPISDALSGVILPAANGVIDALNGLFEDKSFKVEAKAEVEAAKSDLNSLDDDVKKLKKKFLQEQITININTDAAKGVASELQDMFEVEPRLKDWSEEDKEKAFAIIDELNALLPEFDYTPDEQGLKQLQEALKEEGGSVDALIEKYRSSPSCATLATS